MVLDNRATQDSFIKALGVVPILKPSEEREYFLRLYVLFARCYQLRYEAWRTPAAPKTVGWKQVEQLRLEINGFLLQTPETLSVTLKLALSQLYVVVELLVKHNLRLVISIAKKRYMNKGIDMVDLVNEGVLGLMNTVARFNFRLNCKFSTYCIHWVVQRMSKCLNENLRIVRVPMYMINLRQKLEEEWGSEGLEAKQDRQFRRAFFLPRRYIDLHASQKSSTESPFLEDGLEDKDVVSDSDFLRNRYLRTLISSVLLKFNPLEESVLRMYFGLNHRGKYTPQEISLVMSWEQAKLKRFVNTRVNKFRLLIGSSTDQ